MTSILENADLQSLCADLKNRGLAQLKNNTTELAALDLFKKAQSLQEKFHEAQVGKGESKARQDQIRRDKTFWLEEDFLQQAPSLSGMFEAVLQMARENLFLPVKSYECHFSFYQPGDFYLKHRDRHKNSSHRLLTLLFYLNDLPQESGGSLVVDLDSEESIKIQPERGKLVIFDSRLEHEVLTCQADRWAVSGWLRDDEILY